MEAAYRAAGLQPVDVPDDTRSQAAKDFDAGFAPAERYDLLGVLVGKPGIDAESATQIDRHLQTAFSAMGMPANMAPTVAAELVANIASGERLMASLPTEAQQKVFWQGEQSKIASAMRMPYSEAKELAAAAVARMPREVAQDLAARGAFNTATAFVRLAQAEQLRRARSAM